MYKKVLVILHDSILPYMSKPTLMIDFLTAAYEIGKLLCVVCACGSMVTVLHHEVD